MVADLLRWLSGPKPRLIQSRLAVNSLISIALIGKKSIVTDRYAAAYWGENC
jgi:hypothetical protein